MRLGKRKRHEFEVGGARFFVERALGTAEAFDAVKQAHNRNGTLNAAGLLEAFVTDWQGVEDEDGEVLSFRSSLLGRLPVWVAEELANRILEAHGEEAAKTEKELGESGATADSADDTPPSA